MRSERISSLHGPTNHLWRIGMSLDEMAQYVEGWPDNYYISQTSLSPSFRLERGSYDRPVTYVIRKPLVPSSEEIDDDVLQEEMVEGDLNLRIPPEHGEGMLFCFAPKFREFELLPPGPAMVMEDVYLMEMIKQGHIPLAVMREVGCCQYDLEAVHYRVVA